MKKKCFKCNVDKSLKDFYRHKASKDGFLGKCKDCTKKDVNYNRNSKINFYREYDKMRAKSSARKEHSKQNCKKWSIKNPHKKMAQTILNNAKRDGKIKRKPCEVCGTKNFIHAHHDDYSKPLEVIWLCPRHHFERHRRLRIDNERIG